MNEDAYLDSFMEDRLSGGGGYWLEDFDHDNYEVEWDEPDEWDE